MLSPSSRLIGSPTAYMEPVISLSTCLSTTTQPLPVNEIIVWPACGSKQYAHPIRVGEIAKCDFAHPTALSLKGRGKSARELRYDAANLRSLIASKSWTPPPTRLVV